jgi:hypothetical protein
MSWPARKLGEWDWNTCVHCGCAFQTMFPERDWCDDCTEEHEQKVKREGIR